MKISSIKAKGRRACQEVKALLHHYAPHLKDGDIMVPTGSVPGADIHLSPAAQAFYPFAIEVKNQQSLNIWAALKQAESHKKDSQIPILFFKRNNTELYVALNAKDYLQIMTFLESMACLALSGDRVDNVEHPG